MSRLKYGDRVRKNYGDQNVDTGVVGTILRVNSDGSYVVVNWPNYYGKHEYASDLTLLPPLPEPVVPKKEEVPPVKTKPEFNKLDQSFFDWTRIMVERATGAEAEVYREALSIYRAPIMLDALEAAYARIDELEDLLKA